jgi:hypothetical protein
MLDTAGKDCRICGACCASIPRVRDDQGNYYCRTCYNEAIARRGLLLDTGNHSVDPLAETVADESHMDSEASFVQTPGAFGLPASTITVRFSPKDGESEPPLSEDDEDWMAAVARGERPPVADFSDLMRALGSGGLWPEVVGGGSIFFGGAGTIFYGYQALTNIGTASVMYGSAPAADVLLRVGLAALWAVPLALAAWLLSAGLKLVRRRRDSIASLQGWARMKIALSMIAAFIAALVIAAHTTAHHLREQRSTGAEAVEPLDVGVLVLAFAMVIAVLGWLLFWPIAVLRRLRRADVRSVVIMWP